MGSLIISIITNLFMNDFENKNIVKITKLGLKP